MFLPVAIYGILHSRNKRKRESALQHLQLRDKGCMDL
jgi:hypothetical protein